MPRVPRLLRHAWPVAATLPTLVVDAGRFFRLWLRSPAPLAAENLFLRKQLALYQEHHVTPRRATNATRIGVPKPLFSPAPPPLRPSPPLGDRGPRVPEALLLGAKAPGRPVEKE